MKIKNKIFSNLGFKIGILLLLSMLIHFLPDWMNFSWVSLFAPVSESVFQHERIFFSAYIIYSLFEYNFVYRVKNYWISRFLILLLIPWTMIVVYLLPQSFTGKMPNEFWEVFLAIASTLVVWILVIPLENDLEKIKYSQKAKFIISIIFILLALSNVIFTFNLPVYDIFAKPLVGY